MKGCMVKAIDDSIRKGHTGATQQVNVKLGEMFKLIILEEIDFATKLIMKSLRLMECNVNEMRKTGVYDRYWRQTILMLPRAGQSVIWKSV